MTEEAIKKKQNVAWLPILDDCGRLGDAVLSSRFYKREVKDNIVVIMAGGNGTRLWPLTENCPKPLLKIGGKHILEYSILHFKRCGFYRFYVSINYLGHMITDFLKDGSQWGVEINYIKETKRLGTAGALGLLPHRPEAPFLVTNGDIITQADVYDLVQQHVESNTSSTMCIHPHNIKIPFGVVHTDGSHITSLVEKPSYTYLINAGIYCLNPEVLDLIPPDTFYDMTDLFEDLIQKRYKISTYLLEGCWLDVGSMDDYNYACRNLNLLGLI
ncbi:MAG: NTP transferase domain-containing protein [Deltaproteobacteria bacterium]|jgi:NDP-sugar pyrophosphorylase family protein|nr:NTP transferase domain-containing protein [Deltaproteobacteria bacterium]